MSISIGFDDIGQIFGLGVCLGAIFGIFLYSFMLYLNKMLKNKREFFADRLCDRCRKIYLDERRW